MSDVVRWVFHDPTVPESWTMPINPDAMTSPTIPRQIVSTNTGARTSGINRPRLMHRVPQAKEWQFSGVIRTQDHYDQLFYWAWKGTIIQITDHLGRTFEVVIKKYEPFDRQVTQNVPWRAKYTMTCLLLRRIL